MRIKTSIRSQSRRLSPAMAISFAKSVVIASTGILLSLPMIYAFMYDSSTGYLSLFELISLLLFLIGGPVFVFGFISAFNRDRGQISQSMSELDIARIRHAVETELMRRK
jgi:hypothetical protein